MPFGESEAAHQPILVKRKKKKDDDNDDEKQCETCPSGSTEDKFELQATGNTIAGPGMANMPIGSSRQLWRAKTDREITLTIHCTAGTALGRINEGPSVGNRGMTPTVAPAITTSVTAAQITEGLDGGADIRCMDESPVACECLWRIDQNPNP